MIEELQRFLLVAKEGNLTKTAEKIFITQSALTQSIQRLEKELQVKLFFHNGKQLQLTDDGKSLMIIGEKILALWTKAHSPYINYIQTLTYSIGMFDNVALRLSDFLENKTQSKTYHLELIIDSSGKLLKQLQLGTLDAALCVLNTSISLPESVVLIEKYSEKLLPVSAKNFKEKIGDIPFILYNRDSNTRLQIDEIFFRHTIQPTIYAESTSVTFMRELALLGKGVALMPENFVAHDIKQKRLLVQKMPLQWKRDYGLFVQKQYNDHTQFIIDLQTSVKKINK